MMLFTSYHPPLNKRGYAGLNLAHPHEML